MHIYPIIRCITYKVIQKFQISMNIKSNQIQQWILNGAKPLNIHCVSCSKFVILMATATAAAASAFVFFVVASATFVAATTIAATATAASAATHQGCKFFF